jgi:acyl-CoA synthetase (AMP-forming)/AMP-acid ligase II
MIASKVLKLNQNTLLNKVNLLKAYPSYSHKSAKYSTKTPSNGCLLSYHLSDTTNQTLIGTTIGERLTLMAQQKPNDICYKYGATNSTVTFKELEQRAHELAQSLINMGFTRGDRLAVLLPNLAETNTIIMATSLIGVTVVLMNPGYQLVEINYMLKKTKAKGIVILDNLKSLKHYETLLKIAPELGSSKAGDLNSKELPDLKHVIVAGNSLTPFNHDSYKGTWNFKEIEKYDKQKQNLPYVDMDDPAILLFTVIIMKTLIELIIIIKNVILML